MRQKWPGAILTNAATANRDGIFDSTNFVSASSIDFAKIGQVHETILAWWIVSLTCNLLNVRG